MIAIKSICTGIGAAFLLCFLLGSINLLDVRLYIGTAAEVTR